MFLEWLCLHRKKYAVNEILTAYLNTNHLSSAEIFLDDLKDLKTRLMLIDDMSYDNLKNYNKNVYLAIAIFQKIDNWMRNLPPYKHLLSRNAFGFDDLLNHHSFFFYDGQNEFDEPITWDTVTKFGCGEQNEFGNWQTYNRAYKAHYARYMKKKMTIAQFEQRSRFASNIRDKAIAGKIEFDQYYTNIRK